MAVNTGFKPLVKYLHLFPSFLDLECGIAASAAEFVDCLDNGMTFDNCYPQYFKQPKDNNCNIDDMNCDIMIEHSNECYRKDCVFGSLARHDLMNIQASRTLDLNILEGISDDLGKILAQRSTLRKLDRNKKKAKHEKHNLKYNDFRKILSTDDHTNLANTYNTDNYETKVENVGICTTVDKFEKGVQVEGFDSYYEGNNIKDIQKEALEIESLLAPVDDINHEHSSEHEEIMDCVNECKELNGTSTSTFMTKFEETTEVCHINERNDNSENEEKQNNLNEFSDNCKINEFETIDPDTANVNMIRKNEISYATKGADVPALETLKIDCVSDTLTDSGSSVPTEPLKSYAVTTNGAGVKCDTKSTNENKSGHYQQGDKCGPSHPSVYYQWSDPLHSSLKPDTSAHSPGPQQPEEPSPAKVLRPPPGFQPRPPLQNRLFNSAQLMHPGMMVIQPPQPIFVFSNPMFLVQDGNIDFFSLYNNNQVANYASNVLSSHAHQ